MNYVIIFPTDTVYGIGTPIMDTEGIKRIYDIKGRSFDKPLAVLTDSIESMGPYVVITKAVRKLAQAFWPGGLTLILKTTEQYEEQTGEKTLGVRIPNHPLALQLLKELGPMKTTSVNQSGEPPLNDYETILAHYGAMVEKVYPNDQPILEVSSTVLDISGMKVKVLRAGAISEKEIYHILKDEMMND